MDEFTSKLYKKIFILICVVIAGIAVAIYFILKKYKDKEEESKVSPFWLAVGKNTTDTGSILWSTDGQSWEKSSSSGACFSDDGSKVAYGTTDDKNTPLWVAVGNGAGGGNNYNNIMFSTDGQCWQISTESGSSFLDYGTGVAYGLSIDGSTPLWMATGKAGGHDNIMSSTDGKTWTQSEDGASFATYGHGVAYGTDKNGDPMWVATGYGVSDGSYNILYLKDSSLGWEVSDDGGASFFSNGLGVAYGTTHDKNTKLWVAVGNNYTGGGGASIGNILFSEDGIKWSESSGASFGHKANFVAYGTTNDKNTPLWVVVGKSDSTNYNNNILFSTDGAEWEISRGASFGGAITANGNGVAYGTDKNGNPLWIATGDNKIVGSNNILYSHNGMDWLYTDENFGHYGLGVGFNQILSSAV